MGMHGLPSCLPSERMRPPSLGRARVSTERRSGRAQPGKAGLPGSVSNQQARSSAISRRDSAAARRGMPRAGRDPMGVSAMERSCRAAMSGLFVILIRTAKTLTGMPAGGCRFTPSCSAYAAQAIREHAPPRAAMLVVRRLLRCQPLGGGGYDPVPSGTKGSVD
jgi:putative membrane protein insertion efficiency factor